MTAAGSTGSAWPRRRLRVMYALMGLVCPPRSGYAVRVRAIAEALDGLCDLRLLQLISRDQVAAFETAAGPFAADAVISPARSKAHKGVFHVRAILARRSRWVEQFRHGRARESAIRAIETFDPDFVILGHLALWSLKDAYGLQDHALIVDHHNVESVNYARMRHNRTGFGRVLAGVDERALRFLEKQCTGARDHWAVSDSDRDQLQTILGRPVTTVPNIAQDWAFRVEPKGPKQGMRPAVGFMGSFGYYPNLEAAEEFCRVVELMRRHGCDVQAVLVGAGLTASLARDAARAGIEATGFVDDPASICERLTVFLAPIRSGGGTKLKIIESLAMGLPVVTTPVGAEGIPIEREEMGIVATSNAELAAACSALIADPGRLGAMSASARAWARGSASLSALREIVRSRLELLQDAPDTPTADVT